MLCRILVELKLLDTTVGVVVLAAGVGNDVIGWVLLALTVALVNASSGLTALWVLLTGIGWTFFLLFPVKIALRWFLRRTGALETGQPTPFVMSLIFLIVFASAFFTDIIGKPTSAFPRSLSSLSLLNEICFRYTPYFWRFPRRLGDPTRWRSCYLYSGKD